MNYLIERVTDRTGHTAPRQNDVIGSMGRVIQLDEGYSMVLDFGDRLFFSSKVHKIIPGQKIVKVQTQNSVYFLRNKK